MGYINRIIFYGLYRDLMNARAQLWKNITSNGREAQSYYIGQRSIIEQILDKYFCCNY